MSLNIPGYFLVRHELNHDCVFQTIKKLLEICTQTQVKRKLEEIKLETLNSPAVCF